MRGRSGLASPLCLSLCVLCVLCVCVSVVHAFYIPGVAPTEYASGDKLEIKVGLRDRERCVYC